MRPARPARDMAGGKAGAATVLALVLCALPAAGLADHVPVDLDLDRALTFEIRREPKPNPHDAFPCAGCHENTNMTYEMALKYGVDIPLITEGDSSLLLCEECHRESQHAFHPINFAVRRLYDEVRAQEIFPLETMVEGFDRLTCITCHDIHFPHTGNRLLRGFPLVPGEGEKAFSSRLEFCGSCHGADEISAFSSHRRSTPDDRCNFCHLGYRQPGVPGPLSRHLNESCVICHPLPSGTIPHFYNYNPFPDFERSELPEYGLSLEKGGFTCNVCHTHHRSAEADTLLRPGFITIVSKSARVNPHISDRFCRNCHPFRPPAMGTPDAVAPLWEEDVTRLCRGCHSKEDALKMNHPMVMPSREGMVPAEWKMRRDGSLGCQTCHTDGHGPRDPDNRKMLRGGGYASRNGICFSCHDRQAYEGRDIHAEIGEPGSCEFCHVVKGRTALKPEGKVGDLLAEPNFLCLLCHAPPPHPASTDHTGRPVNKSFVTIDDETTPLTMGKLTCHSCHDSHSSSVETGFLRTSSSMPVICGQCHPF